MDAEPETVDRLPTGVPGLDIVLGGGLPRGSMCVLCGGPGAGKTLIASQMAYTLAAAGQSVLYVSLLSESQTQLLTNLRSLAFFDETLVGTRVRYVSGSSFLEGPGGLGELGAMLGREIRAHRAALLVLDSTGSIADIAPTPVAYRSFLRELATSASIAGCTVLVLIPHRQRESSVEIYVSDGVIELCQAELGPRRQRELVVNKLRGSRSLSGLHLFEIDERGARVYPRLEVLGERRALADQPAPVGKSRFGIQGLDDMLEGGVPAGSMTALLGAPGSGKTLLGLHLLGEGLRAGERAVYLGLYETPARLLQKAAGVGLRLDAYHRSRALRILWYEPVEEMLDAIAARLLAEIDDARATRVFLDGLDGMFQAAAHPERFALFFTALSNELRLRGLTAAVSVETNLSGTEFASVPIGLSTCVENIILTRYIEVRSQLHRLVSIAKVRESGYDPSVREFHIRPTGVEVSSTFESAETVLGSLEAQRDARGAP